MSDRKNFEERGVIRWLLRWLVRRYYPQIEIDGAQRIPQTGPVLLCANHANSLLDPILIGIAARRPVRFMTKAPLFETPILGPAMRALGMIPAFRGSDDSRQVHRNLESLDAAAQVLAGGQAMGIFPEGKSTDQAQLEMVRSGAARMALQAAEVGATAVKIVPLGLTYQRKDQFRSAVRIQVAPPIDVSEVLAEHDGNVRKARRAVTAELESRLKEVVVHLDQPQWEPFMGDLETLLPPPPGTSLLHRRKRIADAMNHFRTADPNRAGSVAEEIARYRADLGAAGLSVDSPVLQQRGWTVGLKLFWRSVWLLMLFIPALLGTLHHLAPFVLVRTIASRLDPPGSRMATSTHRLSAGVPIYALWYAAVAAWLFFVEEFAAWFVGAWTLLMPLAGVFALHYWRMAGHAVVLLWHQMLIGLRRSRLKDLRQKQLVLREELSELAKEYDQVAPLVESPAPPSRRGNLIRRLGWGTVTLVIGAAIWSASYWIFDKPIVVRGLDLARLSEPALVVGLDVDERALAHIISGLDELERDALGIQAEFRAGRRSFTTQADNDAVRELLRRHLSYREALFRLLWKYLRYADLPEEKLRLRAFLLEYTAASALYESSLKFVEYFGDADITAKLNEAEPNWGIPAGLHDTVRENLASPENNRMLNAAELYYGNVKDDLGRHGLTTVDPYDTFHRAIARAKQTEERIGASVTRRVGREVVRDVQKLVKHMQYESQSAISTWLGDLKIREPRGGKSLIDASSLGELRASLEPGDILLERRNWYMSNAFLPGYWPHGAVYVGTAADLTARGLDGNKYVQQHWDDFVRPDHDGHEHVIIEAVSQGVIFSSAEHSVGEADAVAILRPRVSEEEKTAAIARAFSLVGRPYDFEFDFSSTDKLVCTEVVFRSYGGNSGPIDFPVEQIMGRPTMPAIGLVEKFASERDRDDAQLDFVAFLDGDEVTGTVSFKDDVAFVETLKLPGITWWSNVEKHPGRSLERLGVLAVGMVVFFVLCGVFYRRPAPSG